MRNGQNNNKRMRNRNNNNNNNNNNRRGQNPMTRVFESNGPDVKIRGTPAHIAEKYLTLSRDAQSSGDPVLAENYLQHAEHYNLLRWGPVRKQHQYRIRNMDQCEHANCRTMSEVTSGVAVAVSANMGMLPKRRLRSRRLR